MSTGMATKSGGKVKHGIVSNGIGNDKSSKE